MSKNMAPRWRGLFSVYICIENFKILLVRKTWPISVLLGWNVALVTHYQDCSSNHDSSKDIAARGGAYFPYIFLNRKLLKSSCQKLLKWFQYKLAGMFLWWPSTKFVQAVMILQKHGLYGVGLYSYIKHFKNLFVRNHRTNFNITRQKCSFGDPLSRFSSSRHDAFKNHGCWGGGGGEEQGYKISTKFLEQWTWLKLQQ